MLLSALLPASRLTPSTKTTSSSITNFTRTIGYFLPASTMGQEWYILSMDNGEILDRVSKLCEFFWNEEADCIVDLLAVPVKLSPEQLSIATPEETGPLPTEAALKPTTCKSRSALTSVPDEILLIIFQELDLVSCFLLSLASRRLWSFGWPFIRQNITQLMGTWAGERIICLGDYQRSETAQPNTTQPFHGTMVQLALAELRKASPDKRFVY